MSERDMESLVANLDWHKPDEVQDEAVRTLASMGSKVVAELIPGRGKSFWKNSVRVIELVGYPENRAAVPGLLSLLQDLSWPGAQSAFNLLLGMENRDLIPAVESALLEAQREADTIWITAIKMLLQRKGIAEADFTDPSIPECLKRAEW